MPPGREGAIDARTIPDFLQSLLPWYGAHGRRLPWRETSDAYAIWLAEIMLQQTRVDTVLSYFRRFLDRFSTVQDLAAASLDEVLKAWEGLGYYARGRNLHRAARIMVERHAGRFPETLEEAMALPGVGRSTAGAVLSIAYGHNHPVLDGNVKRVLLRLHRISGDPGQASVIRELWRLAEELVQAVERPGAFNQAMMELGALVCTWRDPSCPACPVRRHCLAAAAGDQTRLPPARRSRPLAHHDIAVGIIWRDDHLLIQLRPPEGLLGGLWEFPGGKRKPGERMEDCVRREIEEELGIQIRVDAPAVVVHHAYSHFKVTLHAFHCHVISGTPTPRAAQCCRWVKPEQTALYAFPRANRRILEYIVRYRTGNSP